MHRLITTAIILTSLISASAANAKTLLSEKFLIGFWAGGTSVESSFIVGPKAGISDRFAQMESANFNVVYLVPGFTREHLDLCAKYHMQALAQDPRLEAVSYGRNGDPTDAEIDAVVKTVTSDWSKHPGLWSYFVYDEPNTKAFSRIADIKAHLAAIDPAHPAFVNLLPNYATNEQLGAVAYTEYIEKYDRIIAPEFLCWDDYPLFTDGSVYDKYFLNMEDVRDKSLASKKPMIAIIQSSSWAKMANPTEAQFRWQIYSNIAYGAKGIMYYLYYIFVPDTSEQTALVNRDGSLTPNYYTAKKINGEINALSAVLMKLTSTGVYHTGTLPEGTRALPSTGNTINHVTGGDFVVGFFKHAKGSNYAMIVNKDFSKTVTAKLTLGSAKKVRLIDRVTGKERSLPVKGKTCEITLAPGDGVLLRLAR